MSGLEAFLAVFFTVLMGLFAYVTANMVAERREDKFIPLFWESPDE